MASGPALPGVAALHLQGRMLCTFSGRSLMSRTTCARVGNSVTDRVGRSRMRYSCLWTVSMLAR